MTSVFFVFLINETTKLQTNISKHKGKKCTLEMIYVLVEISELSNSKFFHKR